MSNFLDDDVDSNGYLKDWTQWTKATAQALAKRDGIELNEAHWEVIYFLRDFYAEYQHAPAIRALVNAMKQKFGPEKGNSLYLHQLFPQGPAKQASKLAGLPKPKRCI